MDRVKTTAGAIIAGALLLWSACAAPAPSPLTYTVRQSTVDDGAALLGFAEAVLVSEGFEIDEVDAANGSISSKPLAVSSGDATGSGRSIGSHGGARRVATVKVTRVGDATSVYCKVTVEEQATEAHRFLFQDEHGSDLPTDTAIERDAATTAEQNTVWRTVRRDTAAERRIVEAVLTRAGEAGRTP